MQFAQNLDDTETMRADIAGKELKVLVDKLIAIAHQLPDDIGIVEIRILLSIIITLTITSFQKQNTLSKPKRSS